MHTLVTAPMHSPGAVRRRHASDSAQRLATIFLQSLLVLVSGILFGLGQVARAADAAAETTISGWVSNKTTGNLLTNATVEIPALHRTTQTDGKGSFTFYRLPAGTYEVVASYAGLETARAQVTVGQGAVARHNFDLRSDVYQLEKFTVNAGAEGAAAAFVAQKNSHNVKNVLSTDSFGDIPNQSFAEMVGTLPGITLDRDDGGFASGIQIRGTPSGLNRIVVDGRLQAGAGASRSLMANHTTGAGFVEIELTKGHRPDTGADSLGGTINLKSRSPLSMTERRRIDYAFYGVWATPLNDRIQWVKDHPLHPSLNFGYQEVFDLFGKERNLGVSLNLFSAETTQGLFWTQRLFQTAAVSPAYMYDYRPQDRYYRNPVKSVRALVDYRYSPVTSLRFIAGWVDNRVPDAQDYTTRVFTAQSVGTTGTAGVLPGYTDLRTEARATTSSGLDAIARKQANDRNFIDFSLGAEHKFERLEIDYSGSISWSRQKLYQGKAGADITHRVANIGWIIDRTNNDLEPLFVQTSGPDIRNPASYSVIVNGLAARDSANYDHIKSLTLNTRYTLPTQRSVSVKAGLDWRRQEVDEINRGRRWSYIGTGPLQNDTSYTVKGRLGNPNWSGGEFVHDGKPVKPELWLEDGYFHEALAYTGRRFATETITAGYAMVEGQVGLSGVFANTRYLAGVRTERTETHGRGYVRERMLSTAAQQVANPGGSARRDYADKFTVRQAKYTKSFPSAHLMHNITPNLKARLSWSTSFGRPAMTNMYPNEAPDETNRIVTINNPGLLPQMAQNWDATIDYYFKPAGYVSVGWFRKSIEDYIVTGISVGQIGSGATNGFNGEYAGFDLRSSVNGGTATIKGFEIAYQQQFTFLPGLLKGLKLSANATFNDTFGDFGRTTQLSRGQVAGFVPRSYNLIPSWRYKNFSVVIRINYRSEFLFTYNAANPALNTYNKNYLLVNPSVSYDLTPATSFVCSINNILNATEEQYFARPELVSRYRENPIRMTFGVKGRF
ncbi:MAG: TonB-dependent receptor [Opitutus sp.]|nr:TonB-dependent receptor [Opitutus sp.]